MIKEKLDIEQSILAATELVKSGVVHYFIVGCLVNDGFSEEKAETILRWAIQNCKEGK
jgi:hypothetical protein